MADPIAARRRVAEFLFDTAENILEGRFGMDVPRSAFVIVTSPQGYKLISTLDVPNKDWHTLITAARQYENLEVFGVDLAQNRRDMQETAKRERQQYEQERPCICDIGPCGERFKTPAGLKMHQKRNWRHKNMVPEPNGLGWVSREYAATYRGKA